MEKNKKKVIVGGSTSTKAKDGTDIKIPAIKKLPAQTVKKIKTTPMPKNVGKGKVYKPKIDQLIPDDDTQKYIDIATEVVKLIDPTGISSWNDARKAFSDGKLDSQDFIQGLSTLPLVGKFSKADKVLNLGNKLLDLGLGGQKTQKVLDVISRMDPVEKIIDVTKSLVKNAPGVSHVPKVEKALVGGLEVVSEGVSTLKKPVENYTLKKINQVVGKHITSESVEDIGKVINSGGEVGRSIDIVDNVKERVLSEDDKDYDYTKINVGRNLNGILKTPSFEETPKFKEGGVVPPNTIEAEGGELIIKNEFGDFAIIPKNKASEVEKMLAEGCFECIDEVVSRLPVMEDFAEDGTVEPAPENQESSATEEQTPDTPEKEDTVVSSVEAVPATEIVEKPVQQIALGLPENKIVTKELPQKEIEPVVNNAIEEVDTTPLPVKNVQPKSVQPKGSIPKSVQPRVKEKSTTSPQKKMVKDVAYFHNNYIKAQKMLANSDTAEDKQYWRKVMKYNQGQANSLRGEPSMLDTLQTNVQKGVDQLYNSITGKYDKKEVVKVPKVLDKSGANTFTAKNKSSFTSNAGSNYVNSDRDKRLAIKTIYDIDDPKVRNHLNKKYGAIHEAAGHACAAGAFDCDLDNSNRLKIRSIRSLMANIPEEIKQKAKVSSSDIKGRGDYFHNSSVDSWELKETLLASGKAKLLYDNKDFNFDRKYYNGNTPKRLDISKIPIGAIILQGNSKGVYTREKDGNRARHTAVVTGHDKQGVPLVYDYGKIRRITDTLLPIASVIVPDQSKDLKFDNIKRSFQHTPQELGYKGDKTFMHTPAKKVEHIYKNIKAVSPKIGTHYNIPKQTMDKFLPLVVGLGVQESKLNETLSEEERKILGIKGSKKGEFKTNYIDGNIVGGAVKTTAKALSNAYKFATNITGSEEGKSGWEHEVDLYNKYKKTLKGEALEKKIKQELKKIPSESFKKSGSSELKSSEGPYSIKHMDSFTKKEYDKQWFTSVNKGGKKEELIRGARAALGHLAESYKNLKVKYPDLNEDQLVKLSVVAYNNGGKTLNKKYIDNYIRNNNLKDSYFEKVKKYGEYFAPSYVPKIDKLKDIK